MKKNRSFSLRRTAALVLTVALILSLSACTEEDTGIKLDPKAPVTVTIWHYYNGAIMNAFDAQVKVFNETVGLERGIIVEGHGYGGVSDLETAVEESAKQTVGSAPLPNIFASYADTAYVIETMGLLADLNQYLTKEDQSLYMPSYIEEGKIGSHNELRIFPIAKSTEILMLNDTDWTPFATENGLTYEDLSTGEDLARVAKLYYEWTDAKTPDVPNDGKAFYGRDSIANFFVVSSKEMSVELFKVGAGKATVQVDEKVMRKIWDYYYVPFISGYFAANGRYRSDDAKVGDILAYVGSTSSASYFPKEVTVDDAESHPISCKVFPAPNFKDSKRVMVQQGAGMAVTKSTPEEEYASVEFLKWFTQDDINITFSGLSGYLPVKKAAMAYDVMLPTLTENKISMSDVTDATLKIVLEQIGKSEMYTSKAFAGGQDARAVLDKSLQDKAIKDRAAIVQLLQDGMSLEEAVAQYNTDAAFAGWLSAFRASLEAATK